jgi:hypothetical protein
MLVNKTAAKLRVSKKTSIHKIIHAGLQLGERNKNQLTGRFS